MSHEVAGDLESRLRRVQYLRHLGANYHGTGEPAENSLLVFLYDLPYFGAGGIFPPLRVLNEYLLHGGSQGGMSPGATWKPFSLSAEEYDLLVRAIRAISPESLKGLSGWIPPAFRFDPEFEGEPSSYPIHPGYKGPPPGRRWPPGLEQYFAWKAAVCAKHQAR